jgi:hypothetical protein
MNKLSSVGHTFVAAILVGGFVSTVALSSQFEGLVEMQCGSEGCGVVIDGRSVSP